MEYFYPSLQLNDEEIRCFADHCIFAGICKFLAPEEVLTLIM